MTLYNIPKEEEIQVCHQRESNGYCLWNTNGFVFVNFSPSGRIVNSGQYIETLRSLNFCLSWVCPTSVCTTEPITKFGWTVLLHSP